MACVFNLSLLTAGVSAQATCRQLGTLSGSTFTVTARTVNGNSFQTCTDIASTFRFAPSVRTVNSGALQFVSASTIIVESGAVGNVPDHFCAHCGSLQNLWLPDSIANINSNAFRDGPRLRGEVRIGAGTSVASFAFPAACTGLSRLAGRLGTARCFRSCQSVPCGTISLNAPPTTAPTSGAPTSAPTTDVPTTAAPTTAAPTPAPSSGAPVTSAPTSATPTTADPTTAAPTAAPSTAPTTAPSAAPSVAPTSASPTAATAAPSAVPSATPTAAAPAAPSAPPATASPTALSAVGTDDGGGGGGGGSASGLVVGIVVAVLLLGCLTLAALAASRRSKHRAAKQPPTSLRLDLPPDNGPMVTNAAYSVFNTDGSGRAANTGYLAPVPAEQHRYHAVGPPVRNEYMVPERGGGGAAGAPEYADPTTLSSKLPKHRYHAVGPPDKANTDYLAPVPLADGQMYSMAPQSSVDPGGEEAHYHLADSQNVYSLAAGNAAMPDADSAYALARAPSDAVDGGDPTYDLAGGRHPTEAVYHLAGKVAADGAAAGSSAEDGATYDMATLFRDGDSPGEYLETGESC